MSAAGSESIKHTHTHARAHNFGYSTTGVVKKIDLSFRPRERVIHRIEAARSPGPAIIGDPKSKFQALEKIAARWCPPLTVIVTVTETKRDYNRSSAMTCVPSSHEKVVVTNIM